MTLFLCAVRLQLFYPLAFPTLWPPRNLSSGAEKHSCLCTDCQTWTSAMTVQTETHPQEGAVARGCRPFLGPGCSLLSRSLSPVLRLSCLAIAPPFTTKPFRKGLADLGLFKAPSPTLAQPSSKQACFVPFDFPGAPGWGFGGWFVCCCCSCLFSLFVSYREAILISDSGSCSQNWALNLLGVVPRGLTPTVPGGSCWWSI